MEQITASDVIFLLKKQVKTFRENGDSDMRSVLNFVRALEPFVNEGRSKKEFEHYWNDDEE